MDFKNNCSQTYLMLNQSKTFKSLLVNSFIAQYRYPCRQLQQRYMSEIELKTRKN